jgi:hypothetical protein
MLGDPVATETDPDSGGPVYIYDARRESGAGLFAAVASGRATPIEYHHGDFCQCRAESPQKWRRKIPQFGGRGSAVGLNGASIVGRPSATF